MVDWLRMVIVLVGNALTISWLISCYANWVPDPEDRFKGFFKNCLDEFQITHSVVYFLFFLKEFFIPSGLNFRNRAQ